MKKQKNLILFSGVFALILFILTGCGSDSTGNAGERAAPDTAENNLSIVTTIFPEYDWTRQILGENAGNADLILLTANGVDMHSYQPSVDDMIKISNCDLLIYIGGESDKWMNDALKGAVNPDMKIINCMETLGDSVKQEELVEGMQSDDDGDAESGGEHADENGGEYDEIEYDEHIWLSLRNAGIVCEAISGALCGLDPDHAADYQENLDIYLEKLKNLDENYQEAADAARVRTLLFADRFPFRYLTDDYDLRYYAAFAGCSAETEASFETVIFLAEKVREFNLPAVLMIETGDGKIARTVVENTASKSAKILTLDSMQSVTAREISSGAAYLTVMENNLEILREAMG